MIKGGVSMSEQTANSSEPIAIVGMGCRFPGGANNPELFWELLSSGKDAITEVPADRWDMDSYYSPDANAPGKMVTKLAGFLNVDVKLFDAGYFKISPREAELMDPQQRLLLEVIVEALEAAGIPTKSLSGSLTGVFLGISSHDYDSLISTDINKISGVHASTGGALSIASGRVSFILNLKGPCISVDTACSSSLVALDNACHYLREGEINLALVAGVNLMLSPVSTVIMSKAHMLAPDGRCKTFDSSADGFVRGEGCGVVVLKRLSDAKRDNNNILAIIRGSGISQDGARNGLTAPNGLAQKELISNVCTKAGVNPDQIDYVEAHGTGTPLGDPIEIWAIGNTYGKRDKEHCLMIGSVKTNIGHTEAAAGMAGLIKSVLILNNEIIPKSLNFKTLNPQIDLSFPFEIVGSNHPWKRGKRARIAGISSFGYGGTIAHVIIEEAPQEAPKILESKERPLHLLTLSAKTEPALDALIQSYQKFLESTDAKLPDICYSANTGRNHERYRIAVIAKDLSDLKVKLSKNEFSKGIAKETAHYDCIPTGDWAKDLNELATAYVKGAVVDWVQFDASYTRRKVSLPTYPFQRERYWADLATPTVGYKLNVLHPLLGQIQTRPDGEIDFIGQLHLSTLPYLKDHQVFGYTIYPGAGYIEILLAAAKYGLDQEFITLKNISFEAALSFLKGKPIDTQVLMVPNSDGYDISIYSQNADSLSWQCHARGSVIVGEAIQERQKLDIEAVKARCKIAMTKSDFYNAVNATGIQYSEQFQSLNAIYLGQGEAVGELKTHLPVKGYIAHPAILDGCFQLGAASIVQKKEKSTFLPVGCDSVKFYGSLEDHLFAYWKEYEITEVGISGNLTLCSPLGEVLAVIEGLHCRKTTEQALKQALSHENNVDDWLYEWAWQEKSLGDVLIPEPVGHWVVFGDEATSDDVIKQIENRGGSYQLISLADHPKTKEAFVDLLLIASMQEQPLSGILHIATCGEVTPLSLDSITKAQMIGIASYLHVNQALLSLQDTLKVPLYMITKEITTTNIAYSPLLAMFKTISAEHPELDAKLINFETNFDSKLIFEAIFSKNSETLLSFKGSQCYVPRLIKAVKSKDSTIKGKIRSDATYLITGGTGGLGLLLAQWLIDKGAAHVVLTGRRELDDHVKESIKNLRIKTDQISYEKMDVSNEESVVNVLERVGKVNAPLRGIFHLAVVLDDGPLVEQNWFRFEKVLAPKIYGSYFLHKYSRDLDLFVMFSSLASSFGNPGQSNYSAGNGFMDALCEYRRNQNLPAQSLSWGPWAEIGLAKTLVSRHESKGFIAVSPEDGMRAFESALLAPHVHITIVDMNWKNFAKSMISLPPWFQAFATQKSTKENLIDQLATAEAGTQALLVKNYVADAVRTVLGLSNLQPLDDAKGFFEMGLDSLMAIELKNRLQAGVGKAAVLATTAVFDYSTIGSMSQYLQNVLKCKEGGASVAKVKTTIPSTITNSKWIGREVRQGLPRVRVFCFHHAGGGSSAYQSWQKVMPKDVELNLIQLPGRENRSNEPVLTNLQQAVHGIVHAMLDYIDLPYVVFAHSMGTMVASEVIKSLQQMNLPMPKHVIFSSFSPLYFSSEKSSTDVRLSNLDNDALIEFMASRYDGIPDYLLKDRKLLEPFMPRLRGDCMLLETDFEIKELFKADITTIHCAVDKGFSSDEVKQWSKITTGQACHVEVPGGHLSILDDPMPFIEVVKSVIGNLKLDG